MGATQLQLESSSKHPVKRVVKHTILFLAADPFGTDRGALDREARAIHDELERSGYRDQFELVTRWAAEPMDMLRELRRLRPTVVHYCGSGGTLASREVATTIHGDRDGLFFHGPDGCPQFVSTSALEETFGAAGTAVRVVVLSGCFSKTQASALTTRVACVVGLGGEIRDTTARAFAIGFYGGLGDGESVGAAFRQGLAAMRLYGLTKDHRSAEHTSIEQGDGESLPRLVTRPELDPEQLFLLLRPVRRARCFVVIKATLDEFDGAAIARIRDQLRDLTGDFSLEITEAQEGSVRLTVSLSPEAISRLVEAHSTGDLESLIGFAVCSFRDCGIEEAEDGRSVRLICDESWARTRVQLLAEHLQDMERGQRVADFTGAKLNGADFSKMKLEGADFFAADLVGARLASSALMRVDLRCADLEGANLVEANLEGANLVEANLDRANLVGAKFQEANLVGATLVEADLSGADLQGARIVEARLIGAKLREANLVGATLVEADLSGADLQGARVVEARLVGANLEGARLAKANVNRASLEGASLERVDLGGANLVETNLEGANLAGAILAGADLRGANLAGAILGGADLREASLIEANLEGANLAGTNLAGAILGGANLRGAHHDETTLWPEGFARMKMNNNVDSFLDIMQSTIENTMGHCIDIFEIDRPRYARQLTIGARLRALYSSRMSGEFGAGISDFSAIADLIAVIEASWTVFNWARSLVRPISHATLEERLLAELVGSQGMSPGKARSLVSAIVVYLGSLLVSKV